MLAAILAEYSKAYLEGKLTGREYVNLMVLALHKAKTDEDASGLALIAALLAIRADE